MILPKFYNQGKFYSFGIEGGWWLYWDKTKILKVIARWKKQGIKLFSDHQLGKCGCSTCEGESKRQFWLYNLGIEWKRGE